MSAYAAVRQFLVAHGPDHEERDGVLSLRDRRVVVVVVGDGCTPRTAALFAHRSAWRCVSIDPEMKLGPNHAWGDVANLQTMRLPVQRATVSISSDSELGPEFVVVILWHAHVSLADGLSCLEFDGVKWDTTDRSLSARLRSRVGVVTCACCNYEQYQRVMPDGSTPDAEYEDTGCPGLMRTVRVWKIRSPTSVKLTSL